MTLHVFNNGVHGTSTNVVDSIEHATDDKYIENLILENMKRQMGKGFDDDTILDLVKAELKKYNKEDSDLCEKIMNRIHNHSNSGNRQMKPHEAR